MATPQLTPPGNLPCFASHVGGFVASVQTGAGLPTDAGLRWKADDVVADDWVVEPFVTVVPMESEGSTEQPSARPIPAAHSFSSSACESDARSSATLGVTER